MANSWYEWSQLNGNKSGMKAALDEETSIEVTKSNWM